MDEGQKSRQSEGLPFVIHLFNAYSKTLQNCGDDGEMDVVERAKGYLMNEFDKDTKQVTTVLDYIEKEGGDMFDFASRFNHRNMWFECGKRMFGAIQKDIEDGVDMESHHHYLHLATSALVHANDTSLWRDVYATAMKIGAWELVLRYLSKIRTIDGCKDMNEAMDAAAHQIFTGSNGKPAIHNVVALYKQDSRLFSRLPSLLETSLKKVYDKMTELAGIKSVVEQEFVSVKHPCLMSHTRKGIERGVNFEPESQQTIGVDDEIPEWRSMFELRRESFESKGIVLGDTIVSTLGSDLTQQIRELGFDILYYKTGTSCGVGYQHCCIHKDNELFLRADSRRKDLFATPGDVEKWLLEKGISKDKKCDFFRGAPGTFISFVKWWLAEYTGESCQKRKRQLTQKKGLKKRRCRRRAFFRWGESNQQAFREVVERLGGLDNRNATAQRIFEEMTRDGPHLSSLSGVPLSKECIYSYKWRVIRQQRQMD